ncbi:MAG: flagellar hook-length control protein FliK [Gammaproteobacteria bacterium]
MIDIPSGSSPTSATTTSTTSTVTATSAADVARAAVVAKLEAVVQTVQTRIDSGQPQKPAWDILLKLNPQASQTAPEVDSLTPDLLRQLQAGQALLVRSRADLFLPVGTRLQVNVSVAQGVQIQSIQLPDPLPTQVLAQIKQWIPRQQPVQPLLSNVLQLLQTSQQRQLTTLPPPVQAAIKALIQALANPAQVRDPGQLQKLVENSGLFSEGKLARALLQPQRSAETAAPSGSAPSGSAPPRSEPPPAMTQQVKDWLSRIKPASPPAAEASRDSARPSTASALQMTPALQQLLQPDLKHALQTLEKHLQATQTATTAPADGASKPAPAANIQSDKGGSASSPNPLPIRTAGDGTAPAKGADSAAAARPGESTPATNVAVTASTATKSPLAIQRYQSAAPQSAATSTGTDAIPDLIPPLPGQIVVQAQPRSRASLKQDDMADAIVKTLLAQVRGALARVTLHQLSSHSSRQDSGTPTTLSFEIPFLHQQQVEVFQFRIEEERGHEGDKQERKQGKRWVVQMGFDIEGLGPMFCQLSMSGVSMAVQFWAAWEQTLSSTRAHFNFLEQALQGMGIRVEKIQAQLGMPEIDKTGVRNQLVDIKT